LRPITSATIFDVLAPGETDVAFFVGSNEGSRYEGDLPKTGDYTIRVSLDRNAARRGETANCKLEVAIAAAGDVPSEAGGASGACSPTGGALVSGSEFHATGSIPCARHASQPMGSCRFGVIRRGGGSATVRVLWPDGGERNLYFEGGKLDSSERRKVDRAQSIGSEGAAAPVCPQNRAYGSVHGSSRKAYPLTHIKPVA
jgi:hypothetical protein